MTAKLSARSIWLIIVIASLLALFAWVGLRSGPMAAVPVTVTSVESRALEPGLFGVGTVEARSTYRIGPVVAGRVRRIDVDVGDRVRQGQIIGEIDPVDLDERINAQHAALRRSEAQLKEASARRDYARSQSVRYQSLLKSKSVSQEMAAAKRQELQVASAALTVAREEIVRAQADLDAMAALKSNLQLIAPVDGLVLTRAAEPGSTVVAGQFVVEIIDPASLWANVRFDQASSGGLTNGLAAVITLRSRPALPIAGRLERIEPRADQVTEETLAKISFVDMPESLPPLGELLEVEVTLPAVPTRAVIPNAAIRVINGKTSVWKLSDGELQLTPIQPGLTDLHGFVQVVAGLGQGDQIIVYSQRELSVRSRIEVVERLPGIAP